MAQIAKKFIKNNAIDGTKALLSNEEYLRGRNAANDADISIFKVNAENNVEFSVFPRKSGTPTEDDQLVNKSYVDNTPGVLGTPTDTTFSDGLLTFEPTMKTADAVDDINEILKYLAPAQGYLLSSIDGTPDFTISGTTTYSVPKIVGSPSNPLTGVNYESTDTNGGSRTDFINDRDFTMTTPEQGGWGWREADKGTMLVSINGLAQGSVNLGTQFNEANRETGQTGLPWTNQSLSITSVAPTNSFPKWQDGTAQINLTSVNMRSGYNYITLSHTVSSTVSASPRKFWYSPETNPSVSGTSIGTIGTNTTKYLSGVQFYASGTYTGIGCTVNNVYGTSYPTNSLNITSTILTSYTATTPVPTITGGVILSNNHVVSGVSLDIQASKRVLLGEILPVTFTPKSNYGNDKTPVTTNRTNVLVDSYPASSSSVLQTFDDENYRYKNDTDFNSLSLTPNWISTESLVGSNAGINTGLQVYGGLLKYPSQNFSTITTPAAGPNYAGATGRRYYICEFSNPAGKQNFSIKLTGIGSTAITATTGGGIWVELAAPTQTSNGTSFEFKDCMRAYTVDSAIGCVDGALPSGTSPQWNLTIGTKSTANSGFKVIVKISFPEGSTDSISQIDFTFRS